MAVKHSLFVKISSAEKFGLYRGWAVLLLLIVGFSPLARATALTIDGVTTNTSGLYFPLSGTGSSLQIRNGGIVSNSGAGAVGAGTGDNNNSVVVTNTGSAWANTGDFKVGTRGNGNSLVIAGGAGVSNVRGDVGWSANSNSVRVTGTGSAWVNSGYLYLGYYSAGNINSLTIDSGATVSVNGEGWIGGNGNANTVTVTGTGSVWTCSTTVWIGTGSSDAGSGGGVSNKLVIANGGQVNDGQGGVGLWSTANYNSAVVSNRGSVWNTSGTVFVGGYAGAHDSLLVADNGTVIAGTLRLNDSSANNNSVILSNGIILANNITAGGGTYSIVSFGGQLGVKDNNAIWSANMTLTDDGSGNATTITNGASTVSITGILSGNGLLVKAGAGTLTLNAANTYTGGTTVSNGTLRLGVAGAIAGQTTLRVDGGLLDMNGQALTVSALAGNGGSVSNGTLTVNQSSTTTFAGTIAGAVPLTKSGPGSLTLSGNNTYTGGTTVSNGTLVVNSTAGSGAVQVKAGATLGGAGAISGAVTINAGGTLSANTGGTFTLLQAPVLNGTAAIGNGSTLNVGSAWSESATVALQGGTLAGGNLTNLAGGNLQGWGAVRAALINLGSVTATNGELQVKSFSGGGSYQAVNSGTLAFTTGGSLSFLANPNGTVRIEAGAALTNNTIFNNAGTVELAGGTYQTSTRVTNAANLTGYGTISAAAVVNSGTLAATGGMGTPLVINTALANAGWITTTLSALEVTGMFTNTGTLTMFHGVGTFNSAVVNAEAWITDPSTNLFAKMLTVTSTGYLQATNGDVDIFQGDLSNQSTRSNAWQTLNVAPGSGPGSGTKFLFEGTGLTLTQRFTDVGQALTNGFTGIADPLSNGVQTVSAFTSVAGFVDNFAVGELELTNTTLVLAQAAPSLTPNALFVNDLFLTDARLILSNNMQVYFVNSNSWSMSQITLLDNAQIHQLTTGVIAAVPEPSMILLWLGGLAILYVAMRRRARRAKLASGKSEQ